VVLHVLHVNSLGICLRRGHGGCLGRRPCDVRGSRSEDGACSLSLPSPSTEPLMRRSRRCCNPRIFSSPYLPSTPFLAIFRLWPQARKPRLLALVPRPKPSQGIIVGLAL
jgi:hypothetical protein